MISEGKFRADLARAFVLLEQLNLAVYRNYWPTVDQSTTDLLRSSASYLELYNRYLTFQAHDYLLDDGSFFFFRRNLLDSTLLSYGYFESPYGGSSYTKFITEFGGPDGSWEEYEEYCAQRPRRHHVLPLRYDWSPSLYREGAHPASHLHMGYESDLRLAVDALLTPLQFVLLVIRQFYVKVWESVACHRPEVVRAVQAISDSDLSPAYLKGRDFLELRLSRVRNGVAQAAVRPSRARRR
jgi:hypothetical protein